MAWAGEVTLLWHIADVLSPSGVTLDDVVETLVSVPTATAVGAFHCRFAPTSPPHGALQTSHTDDRYGNQPHWMKRDLVATCILCLESVLLHGWEQRLCCLTGMFGGRCGLSPAWP